MSGALYLIIFIIVIALVIVAGVYTVKSAESIRKNPKYANDNDLQTAHKYLTTASITCWVSVAIIVGLVILYFVFGIETMMYTGGWVSLFLMLVALGLAGAVGVLSTLAATHMHASPNFTNNGTDHAAYKDCIIAASLGVGAVGLIVIAFIGYLIYKNKGAKEEANKKNVLVSLQEMRIREAIEKRKSALLQQQLKTAQLEEQLASGNINTPSGAQSS